MPVTPEEVERYNKFKAMHEDKNGNPNEKRIAYEKMQKMIQENPQIKDYLKMEEEKQARNNAQQNNAQRHNPKPNTKKSDIYEDVNKMAEQQINDFLKNIFSNQPKPNPASQQQKPQQSQKMDTKKEGNVFNTVFGMFSNLRKIVSPFDKQKREVKSHITISTTPGQRVSTVTIKIPTQLLIKIIENNEGKEFEAIRNYSGAIFEIAKESFEDDWIKALEIMDGEE